MPIMYGIIDEGYRSDKRLTWAARGVASTLHKRPGLTFDDLKKRSKDEPSTIRKSLLELNCRGYLFRYKG